MKLVIKGFEIQNLMVVIILSLVFLSVIFWFGLKLSKITSELENKTNELKLLKEKFDQLNNNYVSLNSSYYDLIERIRPYFKLNTERQLGIFSIKNKTNISFLEIPLTVEDQVTKLKFYIVEPSEKELMILNDINKVRREHNLTILRLNKAVSFVARSHSKDMAERSYFDHETLEGITFQQRLANNSLYYLYAGENIAMLDIDFLNETVNNWMQSPGHRATILNDDWDEVGVGVFCIYNGTYCYVTADFINTYMEKLNVNLQPNYVSFLYLFDPNTDIGFPQPIKVRIKFVSTNALKFYIVSSKQDFKDYVNIGSKRYVEYIGEVSTLDREVTVYKGYGIMLENDNTDTVYYNITIKYLSV